MARIRTELISRDSADWLWNRSPHATVFTHPDVLEAFFTRVAWWGCFRGSELVSAWPVPLGLDNRPQRSGWFYFVGPLWNPDYFPPAAHRTLSTTLNVYSSFIESLVDAYGGFSACLPPPQTDVRAFSWYRYADGAPIRIEPRYSARLEGLRDRSWDSIIASMRKVRRYELRRSCPDVEWTSEVSATELCDLYLQRTPGERSDTLEDAQRLLALVDAGWGASSCARDAEGSLIAATVILTDGTMTNVVINSVDDAWRSTGLLVHATGRVIQAARDAGHHALDFNGANSPRRGDDKHSFGATPVLYFDVLLQPCQEEADST